MPLHFVAVDGHSNLVKLLEDAAQDQPGHAGRITKRRGGSDEPQVGG
jgi:hypothetical protein